MLCQAKNPISEKNVQGSTSFLLTVFNGTSETRKNLDLTVWQIWNRARWSITVSMQMSAEVYKENKTFKTWKWGTIFYVYESSLELKWELMTLTACHHHGPCFMEPPLKRSSKQLTELLRLPSHKFIWKIIIWRG